MKNRIILKFIIVFIFCNLSQIYGQTLDENKIDDFTNLKVKRTSWETLNMTYSYSAYFRISRINDNNYFDLKMMLGGKAFSIDKNQEIMFKLNNNEFVKLQNPEFTVTCTGCGAKGFNGSGAQGLKISYPLNEDDINKLKNNTVVKIRIYTNDGYVENDTKESIANKIPIALMLVE